MAGSTEARGQVFTRLCADFSLAEPVKKLLMDSKMESLEDLKFYWSDVDQIDAFVTTVEGELGDTLKVQISRVRQAWQSLHEPGYRNKLLKERTLWDLKVNFWKRHKLKYPAEITPGDGLISRCYHELDSRLLSVIDLWTARSSRIQATITEKRGRREEDRGMTEEDMSVTGRGSIGRYLELMHTYLLALSIASSQELLEGEDDQEVFSSDSAEHISAPWDLMQAYYFRAARSVQVAQGDQSLSWLEKVDTQERAIWVQQYCEGTAPIGQVIRSTMERRNMHWEPPPMQYHISPLQSSPQLSYQCPEGKDERDQDASQSKVSSDEREEPSEPPEYYSITSRRWRVELETVSVARILRNGNLICPEFQRRECEHAGKGCQKGLHKCSRMTSTGKVCGSSSHGAEGCKR